MKRGLAIPVESLDELQKQILVERHLISRELCHTKAGAGIVISKDQSCVVMVNEEDHLRIQVLRAGFQFKKSGAPSTPSTPTSRSTSTSLQPAPRYLSACPTNLGTGIRASAMMHCPRSSSRARWKRSCAPSTSSAWLCAASRRGFDASGSIFQISNQTTLGESEEGIIKHLHGVLNTIIEQELNARQKLLETDPNKLSDKIGRAFGILQNGYLLNSGEAMNLLSLIRLGIDLEVFPDTQRAVVDRLFIECQPGHVPACRQGRLRPAQRDVLRAARLRSEFAKLTIRTSLALPSSRFTPSHHTWNQ